MSFETCDPVAHLHLAHLQVHVAPATEPHIRRYCARCKGQQPFRSSGKFRVNANGKALDAWLIYRCDACDAVWNYPIHERRTARSFDVAELEALMQNDAAMVRRHASDAQGLRAAGAEIVPVREVALVRTLLRPVTQESVAILLSVDVAPTCQVRLDRLIAWALSVRRQEVLALHARGMLQLRPSLPRAFKRPASDGQQAWLTLSGFETSVDHLQENGHKSEILRAE